MIPDFLKTQGFLFSGSFALVGGGNAKTTFAFAPGANQGWWHSPLPNYATSQRPAFLNTFNLGGANGTPLAGYDEIFVHVQNDDPGGTGLPVVVQFGWRGLGTALETNYEMVHDEAPASADASALTAGATNNLGVAANVRRYVPSIAEFGPIEISGGRVFRVPVKGPFFTVGAAVIGGAAVADQVVLVQLVPRTIGVPRGG